MPSAPCGGRMLRSGFCGRGAGRYFWSLPTIEPPELPFEIGAEWIVRLGTGKKLGDVEESWLQHIGVHAEVDKPPTDEPKGGFSQGQPELGPGVRRLRRRRRDFAQRCADEELCILSEPRLAEPQHPLVREDQDARLPTQVVMASHAGAVHDQLHGFVRSDQQGQYRAPPVIGGLVVGGVVAAEFRHGR